MDSTHLELQLPGFRFHPTEEELLKYYLLKMASGKNIHFDIIGCLNIYLYDPWVLPGLSKIGEREWYFFVPRDRKHGSGGRPNRTTKNGFWKATGSDRKIFGLADPKKQLGLKKTLVFYKGRAPRGSKTDWVMNEYRLPDSYSFGKEIVLCKIYRKATSMKVLEQRAAMEEETQIPHPLSPEEAISFHTQSDDLVPIMAPSMTETESCQMTSNDNEFHLIFSDDKMKQASPVPHDHHDLLFHMLDGEVKEEPDAISDATSYDNDNNNNNTYKVTSLKLPSEDGKLLHLQLPKMNMDWTQDSFWTQLCSPWLDNIMFSSPYANLLNF